MPATYFRQLVGVIAKELYRYLIAIYSNGYRWLHLCNRNEQLIFSSDGRGVECNWRHSSMMHAPTIIPWLGKRLLIKASSNHPFQLAKKRICEKPDVSVIIGHRGVDRIPHLLLIVKSIAGQDNVDIECIVVEQSDRGDAKLHLPEWVRYHYTPVNDPKLPYNRSWAFNEGAKIAEGKLLIFHDNDLLIPKDYVRGCYTVMQNGYEVINLKRFIFYLTEKHSKKTFEREQLIMDTPPEWIMQNATGGGSIAIKRHSFFEIGGFDEEFVGWGGEDDEFWERAQTLKVWPFGSFPLIHLWHPAQTEKYKGILADTYKRYRSLSEIAPRERIKRLLSKTTVSSKSKRQI